MLAAALATACAGTSPATKVDFAPRATDNDRATLRVRVAGEAPRHLGSLTRKLTSLPNNADWTEANIVFTSPTALNAGTSATLTVPKANWTLDQPGPYHEFVASGGSTPAAPVLRPSTDYTIKVELRDAVSSPNSLAAYGQLTGQTLNAGANTITVTLAVTGNTTTDAQVDGSASTESTPRVSWDSANNMYLVVWARGGDIYARRYNVSGVAQGGGAVKVNSTSGGCAAPAVAYNAVGAKHVIVWQDNRNGHNDIFVRSIDNSDVLDTEAALDHTGGHTANQTTPRIASSTSGDRLMVCWTDDRAGGADLNVYGNRIKTDFPTTAAQGETTISSLTANQRVGSVAYSDTDKFFCVFEDESNFGTSNIDLRFANVEPADGSVAASGVITTAAGAQDQPSVCYGNVGASAKYMLTAWRDDRNAGNQRDIYYNIYNLSSASLVVADTSLISDGNAQRTPAVSFNSLATRKEFMIFFSDDRNSGTTGFDLFSRRLKSDGTTQFGEKLVSNASDTQDRPAVAYGSTTDVFMSVFEDSRNFGANGVDIYLQPLR